MLENFRTFQQGIWRLMFMPSAVATLNVRGNRRYRQAKARLRRSVELIIADYRSNGGDRGDLLSMLLSAQLPGAAAHGGQAMFSEEELADQCVTFLFGVTETAADALAWALHFVAEHPEGGQPVPTATTGWCLTSTAAARPPLLRATHVTAGVCDGPSGFSRA